MILSVPRGALDTAKDNAAGDESSPLSRREMEILLAVARGMSNKQAAEKLHLSVTTVKRHLSNIYEKLKVGSRGEATRKAISRVGSHPGMSSRTNSTSNPASVLSLRPQPLRRKVVTTVLPKLVLLYIF